MMLLGPSPFGSDLAIVGDLDRRRCRARRRLTTPRAMPDTSSTWSCMPCSCCGATSSLAPDWFFLVMPWIFKPGVRQARAAPLRSPRRRQISSRVTAGGQLARACSTWHTTVSRAREDRAVRSTTTSRPSVMSATPWAMPSEGAHGVGVDDGRVANGQCGEDDVRLAPCSPPRPQTFGSNLPRHRATRTSTGCRCGRTETPRSSDRRPTASAESPVRSISVRAG